MHGKFYSKFRQIGDNWKNKKKGQMQISIYAT